ncbi:response regulator [Rhodobacteraceae bacterium 2376]|uniref:histidine kinase n=1 Tax=Rhabdonatronobacter sediminivivens TaxID=2743469 RepID=A0A7Z0I047_9RHOB|nr:ATP-binding protein [Rhabdonatronobacter sediminivivens]NYS25500.1 response regulator [Rhabdonatronobacter sediminivivens]
MQFAPDLRIALIFAALSVSYIFVSDRLVELFVDDVRSGTVQTAKGTAFVLVSALVIYLLIRAELAKQERLRQAAMRAQRLEAIGQLATVMAHDFNNILTVAIGSAEIAEDALPPVHPARIHLENSMNAAEKAGKLAHQMLVFSRQGHLPSQPVDANQSINDLIPLLTLATGEQVSLRCKLAHGLPPVNAEPYKFENILLNLIINARDAMPQGGEIVLETARERLDAQVSDEIWTVPPGEYVTVSVRDTGHGMSKPIMRKILEPFYTTKPMGRGTGLGLTTLREGMQAWKGHLQITSAVGLGTTIKMYLRPAPYDIPTTREEKRTDATVSSRGETILLVENEADVRASVASQLKNLGYVVRTAADLPEACELLRAGHMVDLLLSDIMLNGTETGVALAKQARAFDKGLKVVLMSGYADPVLTAEMANFADLGWLAKPFDRFTLNRELRRLLD